MQKKKNKRFPKIQSKNISILHKQHKKKYKRLKIQIK